MVKLRKHGGKCSLSHCDNKVSKGLYSFPTIEAQKKSWLSAFGLSECKPSAKVCYLHFRESDIVTNKLKYGAVPSQNLQR